MSQGDFENEIMTEQCLWENLADCSKPKPDTPGLHSAVD